HQGKLHLVGSRNGASCWCEHDDLVPEAPERAGELAEGTRVWALWVDGHWFPGVIDGCEGPVRHVSWDDGDSMWVDIASIVVMAAEGGTRKEGALVLAKHWSGNPQPARVEQEDGHRFRVVFRDGEDAWVPRDDLTLVPPCPFNED